VPGRSPRLHPENDQYARSGDPQHDVGSLACRDKGRETGGGGNSPQVDAELDAADDRKRCTPAMDRTSPDDKRGRRAGNHRKQQHCSDECGKVRRRHAVERMPRRHRSQPILP
jgi:hypothetical protein